MTRRPRKSFWTWSLVIMLAMGSFLGFLLFLIAWGRTDYERACNHFYDFVERIFE